MKRVAIVFAILALAAFTFAQAGGSSPAQNPPAQNPPAQNPPAQNPPAAQPGAATQGKRPPQAKTQPEFDAYKAATAIADPTALEKAADDFAAKFPDSELRVLLYKQTMQNYGRAGNSDNVLAISRKALAIDPNDPDALIAAAEVLAERTRDTDLDKNQRMDEAVNMAQKAMQTLDTDIAIPPGTPQERIDAFKGQRRAFAYSIIGLVDYKRENYAAAESEFRKSIEAFSSDIDPVTVLRLAISLDKQNKYPEALEEANRAVGMTQENTEAGTAARNERNRLVQLTGGKPATPTTGSNPPPATATPPK